MRLTSYVRSWIELKVRVLCVVKRGRELRFLHDCLLLILL